jgi:hypothetical protein
MIRIDFNRPLGMGMEGSPLRKEWVQVALAAAGLASSLLGGAKASKAAKEAEKRQRQQEARENAWYNRRYNEDYLDTAAGQNLVRRAKEYARENWKKAQGAAKVGGATEAASAMAKEAGNKMVGDTMANIAAQDTARKARVDDQHRQAEANFAQMDIARENQRAANITQAAQGASNAMLSMAGALGENASGGNNLQGGSNNSTLFKADPSRQNAYKAVSEMRTTANNDVDNLYKGLIKTGV